MPQPAHDRTKAELKRDAFTYDEKQDVYRCPNGKQHEVWFEDARSIRAKLRLVNEYGLAGISF